MVRRSNRRLVRLAAVLVVVVAIIAVGGYGAMQLLAPGATSATPTGSSVAQASSSPGASATRPAITPVPAVSFTPAQTAQIAFCLAAQETKGLDADIVTARAAVTAADHVSVAADGAALVTRIAEMRLAVQEMTGLPELSAYAAAYDAGLKGVGTAAQALATAGQAANAKGEAQASTALGKADTTLHASDARRTTLIAADPQLACTAAG